MRTRISTHKNNTGTDHELTLSGIIFSHTMYYTFHRLLATLLCKQQRCYLYQVGIPTGPDFRIALLFILTAGCTVVHFILYYMLNIIFSVHMLTYHHSLTLQETTSTLFFVAQMHSALHWLKVLIPRVGPSSCRYRKMLQGADAFGCMWMGHHVSRFVMLFSSPSHLVESK